MTVYVRIILYVVSGWLASSGAINDELRDLLRTDPQAASYVQMILSGAVAGASWAWWRLAKRFGWST